jgi:hypothetical protein
MADLASIREKSWSQECPGGMQIKIKFDIVFAITTFLTMPD